MSCFILQVLLIHFHLMCFVSKCILMYFCPSLIIIKLACCCNNNKTKHVFRPMSDRPKDSRAGQMFMCTCMCSVYVHGLSLVSFCHSPTAPPGCQPTPAWPGSAPALPSAPEIPVHPAPSSRSGAAQRTPHAKHEHVGFF